MDSNEHSDHFSLLRKQFVSGLSQRTEDLNSALSNQGSPESIRMVLHQLIGAAGIFGYENLGELAKNAMHALETNKSGKPVEEILKVRDAMDQLSKSGCNDTI
jgi:HPt (histidine-containing phosphotransfer) domain-containing protein